MPEERGPDRAGALVVQLLRRRDELRGLLGGARYGERVRLARRLLEKHMAATAEDNCMRAVLTFRETCPATEPDVMLWMALAGLEMCEEADLNKGVPDGRA